MNSRNIVTNPKTPKSYEYERQRNTNSPGTGWKLEVVSSAITPPGFARAAVKFAQRKCEKSLKRDREV